MSNQIVERELGGFICELQDQGREDDADQLGEALEQVKGNLTELVRLRDEWDIILSTTTPKTMDKPKGRNVFCFNPEDNGGESFMVITEINEEGHMTQEVSLQSYGAEASFNIPGWMTPEKLRELANQLDSLIIRSQVS
jgi:hypothetical protein